MRPACIGTFAGLSGLLSDASRKLEVVKPIGRNTMTKWPHHPNLRKKPHAPSKGRGPVQRAIRRVFMASGAEVLNSTEIYNWAHGRRRFGRRKSMPFGFLNGIIGGAGRPLRFVSLQVGPERDENTNSRVLDMLPERPTWDDTAAIVAKLDLVITVDTSVAHLAGALGVPVFLMMHTEGSWHWMAQRPGASWNDRSPWYPSVQIFRQERPHEWDGVLQAVAEALEQRIHRHEVRQVQAVG